MDLYGHTFTRRIASNCETGIYSDRQLSGLPLDGNQRRHAGYGGKSERVSVSNSIYQRPVYSNMNARLEVGRLSLR